MAKTLRGRPSKAYKESLKGMSQKNYSDLEKACIEAYLLGHRHVILAVSYLTKFDEDFPNTTTVRRDGKTVYVKVYTSKLMKWLYDKGHTHLTANDIRAATARFTKFLEGNDALQEPDW